MPYPCSAHPACHQSSCANRWWAWTQMVRGEQRMNIWCWRVKCSGSRQMPIGPRESPSARSATALRLPTRCCRTPAKPLTLFKRWTLTCLIEYLVWMENYGASCETLHRFIVRHLRSGNTGLKGLVHKKKKKKISPCFTQPQATLGV